MEQNFTFYDIVHKLATNRGITIKKFEEDNGIALHGSAKWKKSRPSFNSLLMVADYFDVSVDSLLGRETTFAQEEIDLIHRFRSLTNEQKNSVMILIDGYTAQSPLKKDTEIS